MKKLRDVMRPGFLTTVPREASVADAVRAMTRNNVGLVVVEEDGLLVGVFSERDVVRRVIDRGRDPTTTRLDDVLTTDLVVADPEMDYQEAMRIMDQANIRHLPVVEDGKLLSMISIRDLVRLEIDRTGEELRYLHEYLFQVPAEALAGR
jgi:CBS domain-containing protein